MKRRFEVSYYEYGTIRTKRRFFFKLLAYLYKAWLEYNDVTPIEIHEDHE